MSSLPVFVPGLQLCRQFYWEAVRPILDKAFPDLSHSAALIGSGSEVLGFDDAMSTDHYWGPRLQLFLDEADRQQHADEIRLFLAWRLPFEFQGYPTHFSEPDPDDGGTQLMQTTDSRPVNHRVEITTIRDFFGHYLGFNLDQHLEAADWLTFPEQVLRTITAGAVYHDDLGLQAVRDRFSYYPHDVWLYLLAAGWERIGQEEHLMGRAGIAGDEIGSALIAGRLVGDIMRLCFLMEQTYAPYAKWFGTAFEQLRCAVDLSPVLQQTLQARSWQSRDRHLAQAYKTLATMHNALNVTEPFPREPVAFFNRPFQVMAFHGFAAALRQQITDPTVRRIAERPPIGGIDQISDNTDLLSNPSWRPFVRRFYE